VTEQEPQQPAEWSVALAEQALMDQLFALAGRSDPHAALRQAPIPGVRYAFVRDALHDRRLIAPHVPDSPDLIFQLLARFMPRLPPERHAAVRRKFSGLFSARRVTVYQEVITARCEDLLRVLQLKSGGDLAAEFAEPLPFAMIANVLGVEPERQDWLWEAMATLGRGFAGQRTRPPVEAANVAAAQMLAYFDELLGRRAHEPRDDLASMLAAGDADPEQRQDLLANCIFFILAGHSTTATMLCAGLDVLLARPDAVARLMEDPTRWDTCIEEILRYVSPITLTGVRAETDVTVAGHDIPAGGQRIISYAAANRDPETFLDPDTFDPERSPNPHLAFSAGATFCLGAPLARMHARIALPMLLTRLPSIQTVGPPQYRGSTPVRQVESFRATW
jgi:pimeloyl-[acyl-carrier protein] synthase